MKIITFTAKFLLMFILTFTLDSQTTWVTQTSATNSALYEIYFMDANTGFTAGANGTMRKTTNGGTTWIGLNSGTTQNLYEILIANTGYAYSVGNTGTIRCSTNNGNNWIGQTSGTNQTLYDVRFPYISIGVMNILCAIGNNGTILRTTNGGTNWTPLNRGTNNDLHEIHFTTYEIGYTVGNNGIILNTTNGGTSWTQQVSNTNNNLWSVFFVGYTAGFTVGENGTIRKTTTGIVGIEPVINSTPDKFSLNQNYPNPFNPNTSISFHLSKYGLTKLLIHDITGREITSLFNSEMQPGYYEINWDASNYPSGIYFYTLYSSGFTDSRKMILTK